MTDEANRLERALADIEAAGAFLRSRYFEAVITRAVTEAQHAANSPWLTRDDAAAYARCSTSEIDRVADAGVLPRYQRGGTPMFRKDDIDAAITDGRWPKRSALARAA